MKWGKVSVRRTQIPVTNYVSLTCHKLMGDTFPKIATQLSVEEKKYTLWLASQLYVIISRVRDLRNVIFVGDVYVVKQFILLIIVSTVT